MLPLRSEKNIIPFNLLMSDLFFIPKRGRREGVLACRLAFFKAFFWEGAAAQNDISSNECVEPANCSLYRPQSTESEQKDVHSFRPSAQK